MPRIQRKLGYTKVYHAIIRGIDKQDIFFESKDYQYFLKILKETKEKYQYDVYAYCLMNNHVHLVIFDKKDEISKIMQTIEIRYSIYFNKKYERTRTFISR